MSKQNNFWDELESRLEENAHLVNGGVPDWLKPLAAYVGLHFWQSLLMLSGIIVVILSLVLGEKIIDLSETLLLIW